MTLCQFLYVYSMNRPDDSFIFYYFSSRFKGYLTQFSSQAQKIQNLLKNISYIYSKRFSLYCKKWNFLVLRLKKFLVLYNPVIKIFFWNKFLMFFQKKPTLKKIPILWEMELASPKTKNSQKRFPYLSGNWTF